MIRVLHTIGTLEIGGEQRYLARLTRHLDPARFHQTVAFFEAENLKPEFAPGVEFVKMSERRPTARNPRYWPLVASFAKLIRDTRADIVTTHGAGMTQISAAAAARFLRIPNVHTIQRPFANRSRTEDITISVPGLRHAIYALTDRFIALGTYYAVDQRERWRIPAEKIHLSYIGVELDKYHPDAGLGAEGRRLLGLAADVPLLGIVARQEQVKGILRGLEAFAGLRKVLPDARLLLVGDGRQRAANEARASELGVADGTIFAGARTDTARMMNACDAVMQTTYNPLNGIVSIEGMAVGKPIVTVVESVEEERMAADTCDEAKNGLFFRMTDLGDSADRLAALLRDKARLAAFGAESRRMAESRFEISSHVADVENLYESLVGRTARPEAHA